MSSRPASCPLHPILARSFAAAGAAFLVAVVVAQAGRPGGDGPTLSSAPAIGCLGNAWCACGAACACGSGCACGVDLDSPPVGAGLEDYESRHVDLLSRISLPEFGLFDRANDCWGYVSPSGREYALISLDSALAVVEITDPAAPAIVGMIPHEWSVWGDVKTHGEYAYSVNESDNGIQVIDLRDVDAGEVSLVTSVTAQGLRTSHNIAVNNDSGYVYTCGSNISGGGLVAWSLANPRAPEFAGAWSGRYVHDAQIVTYTEGPFAGREIAFCFVGRQGLAVVDVTNKSAMTMIAIRAYPSLGYCHQGWLSDDRQYLYVNDELDEQQFGILRTRSIIYDVSDIFNPRFVRTFTSGRPASDHNLYVHGAFIFEANYRSGLRIFNATAPREPVETGFFDTHPESDAVGFSGAWSLFAGFPSGVVIVSDISRGLFVLDVAAALDPENYDPPVGLPGGGPGGGRPGVPGIGGPNTTPGGATYFDLPDFPTVFSMSAGPAPGAPPSGDLNGDGQIDAADLAAMLAVYGAAEPSADLDGDGVVGAGDLGAILARWSPR